MNQASGRTSPATARQTSGATPRRGRAISSATAAITSAAKAMSYRAAAATDSTPALVATISTATAAAPRDESRRADLEDRSDEHAERQRAEQHVGDQVARVGRRASRSRRRGPAATGAASGLWRTTAASPVRERAAPDQVPHAVAVDEHVAGDRGQPAGGGRPRSATSVHHGGAAAGSLRPSWRTGVRFATRGAPALNAGGSERSSKRLIAPSNAPPVSRTCHRLREPPVRRHER